MSDHLKMDVARSKPAAEKKKGGNGSLAYRKNKEAIWDGNVPEKYTRILDYVPGQRVLELGSAEGVLALLLSETKEAVLALEMKKDRHEEALRLQEAWRNNGMDVDRCEMIFGKISERLDLLKRIDTLLAVRSIYYLRSDLLTVFDAVAEHVENVVLCGNRHRAKAYFEPNENPDDKIGDFNYYATLEGMRSLLENRGYIITETVSEGDPIVVGVKHAVRA